MRASSVRRSCPAGLIPHRPDIATSGRKRASSRRNKESFAAGANQVARFPQTNNRSTTSISCLQQGTRRAAGQHFTIELNETVKLAWPMVLTQLAQVAMMTADIAFIGHIGPEALAAAALAVALYLVRFTIGAGLVAPIARLAAQGMGPGILLWYRAQCARAYRRRCYYRSRS